MHQQKNATLCGAAGFGANTVPPIYLAEETGNTYQPTRTTRYVKNLPGDFQKCKYPPDLVTGR